MDRKLIINLCVFTLLICFTAIVGSTIEPPAISEERAELMSEEEIAEEQEKGLLARRYFTMAPMILVIVVYGAILFATYILPSIVYRATHTIYDSGEMVEEDPLHDARSLFAQGDYEGAIEGYRAFAQDHQGDRFPWVEIAKMQNVHLEDPDASIATLREALASYDWEVRDAAFMMFRVAELYEREKEDLKTTMGILQQVVEMFPETRHAANATHRLRELGAI